MVFEVMAEESEVALPDTCELSGQEHELERLAVEELVNEAKRAKERSQSMGSYGWSKRKVTTNKRFLHSTLVSTLREYRTDFRHRRQSYGHDQRDEPIATDPNLNSKDMKEKGNDSNPMPGTFTNWEDSEKGEDPEFISQRKSNKPERPRNYHDHQRKEKRRRQSQSCSPLNEEGDKEHLHSKEYHQYKKRSKHKKKHKHEDRHSRSDSHKSSRKHNKSPRRRPDR